MLLRTISKKSKDIEHGPLLEEPSSPGYVSMQEARVKKNKDRKGIKFWSRMYI